MLHAQASERELIDQFLAALRSLPEVQAELERAGAPELDAQLALHVAGKPIHALVELRKAVYLRDPYDAIMDQYVDLGLQDDVALIRSAARSLASARSVRSTP